MILMWSLVFAKFLKLYVVFAKNSYTAGKFTDGTEKSVST